MSSVPAAFFDSPDNVPPDADERQAMSHAHAPVPERTDVLVAGAGPAGMLLGLLLAGQGLDVVVLDSSATSHRTFRGESISPDSVRVLRSVGVLDHVPDDRRRTVSGIRIVDAGHDVLGVDFASLSASGELPHEIPQDVLLEAAAERGSAFPGFHLIRPATAVGVIREGGRVTGLRVERDGAETAIRARVVVAADGRYGTLAADAGIAIRRRPAARDFLWFKITPPADWDATSYQVRIDDDAHAMCIPTVPDLLRLGINIPSGGLRAIRKEGIGAFHDRVAALVPELADPVREQVRSWRDTSMLEIFTSAADRWWLPGFVAVGDAAHTLSPVLAQGVNHAILDALVLADQLGPVLVASGDVEVDTRLCKFADLREPRVAAARALQLRQEFAFAQSGPIRTLARRGVYRTLDAVAPLRARIWGRLYYSMDLPDDPAAAALDRLTHRMGNQPSHPSSIPVEKSVANT